MHRGGYSDKKEQGNYEQGKYLGGESKDPHL